jgi:Vacuolar protein 14 C-terminal Fig4p binding
MDHLLPASAELEITVQLLVQIDKLVQLIESPVFTCRYSHFQLEFLRPELQSSSLTPAITGARKASISVQMPVRTFDVASAEQCLHLPSKPS